MSKRDRKMRNTLRKGAILILLFLCQLAGCQKKGVAPSGEEEDAQEKTKDQTTDLIRDDSHEEITWELIRIVEHDPDLKRMLERSIEQAVELNPDPDTQPVKDLDSYYDFVDRCSLCMPWQISPSEGYSSLYDRIDQGMGCLYFICDQPLEELSDKGYYHNSLMYHEPFRSWFIGFLSVSGQFLSTEASWNEEYYQTALQNPDFHMDDGTYEDPSNWKSFNDFFARKLKDPSIRPIASPDDAGIVVSPADSQPQGIWKIDEDNRIIENEGEKDGTVIKTGRLKDVSVLLKGSAYADRFAKGTMSHTFLDINDYHRYHVPVSGTIREVLLIRQDDAPGGVITWDREAGHYVEYGSDTFGWQSIETRGVVIIEMDGGGYVAVVPVGMCQVSSVNFEEDIVPGKKVSKGDPLGYFLFSGSDIVMLFSEDLDFHLSDVEGKHLQMGQEYGRIAR